MAATYTVNGQQMTEEEFLRFQEEMNMNFGHHFRKKRRWDHKPHIYQGYKDVQPGLWQEISKDDLKHDTNRTPNFLKEFFYVQSINREYIIESFPVVAVFYDHINDDFLYMKPNGLISEHNCFKTEDDALNAILALENKKEGHHKVLDALGNIILEYDYVNDTDSSTENNSD